MAAKTLLLKDARAAEHRFWPKVDKRGPDECWPWTGRTKSDGYGWIRVGSRNGLTHRLSWCLANSRNIPDGLCVLHRCDRPPCVNPAHLWLGTNADNVADRTSKGRGWRPRGESHPRASISRYAARIVCRMAVSGKWKQREVAAGFRISQQLVSAIKHGQAWAFATADIRAESPADGGRVVRGLVGCREPMTLRTQTGVVLAENPPR